VAARRPLGLDYVTLDADTVAAIAVALADTATATNVPKHLVVSAELEDEIYRHGSPGSAN
jgi:hypothetical protein